MIAIDAFEQKAANGSFGGKAYDELKIGPKALSDMTQDEAKLAIPNAKDRLQKAETTLAERLPYLPVKKVEVTDKGSSVSTG